MTYQLICRGKRLVFHLSPRDGHVITVSGCLILTAANSSSYGWLTKCQFLQDVTFDISLHEVCVRVGVRYVITKFSRMDSLPNFLTHGAPRARASRARELGFKDAPFLLLVVLILFRLGGERLWPPLKIKLNNFTTVKPMTAKLWDFPKNYLRSC